MRINRFTVNSFGENTYILWDEDGSDAIIVDPGMSSDRDRKVLDDFLSDNDLNLKSVLLTHQHVDHVLSAKYLSDRYSVPIKASSKDSILGEALPEQIKMFGLQYDLPSLIITEAIQNVGNIILNGEPIQILETPGHTLGGLSFYMPESGFVIVGDSIFQQSIGRTDLPGGDYQQLINSIKTKLFSLPDETVIYPGHGGTSTIGDEKLYNPYVH